MGRWGWLTAGAALGLLGVAPPALAAEGQLELWAFQEWSALTGAHGWGQPERFRVGLVERANQRLGPRLQQALVRLGPQWRLGPSWELGLQLLSGLDQPALDRWQEEERLELEARVQQAWGPWRFWGRGRWEGRALLSGPRQRWRLLGNLSRELPEAWGLGPQVGTPFASVEAFWEPQAGGLNQWRFQGGWSWPGPASTRLAIAYVLRPRLLADGWAWDHVLSTTWAWRELAPAGPGPLRAQ